MSKAKGMSKKKVNRFMEDHCEMNLGHPLVVAHALMKEAKRRGIQVRFGLIMNRVEYDAVVFTKLGAIVLSLGTRKKPKKGTTHIATEMDVEDILNQLLGQ